MLSLLTCKIKLGVRWDKNTPAAVAPQKASSDTRGLVTAGVFRKDPLPHPPANPPPFLMSRVLAAEAKHQTVPNMVAYGRARRYIWVFGDTQYNYIQILWRGSREKRQEGERAQAPTSCGVLSQSVSVSGPLRSRLTWSFDDVIVVDMLIDMSNIWGEHRLCFNYITLCLSSSGEQASWKWANSLI